MPDIVSTHVEEIFKAFHNNLPPPCVEIIIRLHEENRQLQTAVNDLTLIVTTLKEVAQLSAAAYKNVNHRMKQFEEKHSDSSRDLLNEDIH